MKTKVKKTALDKRVEGVAADLGRFYPDPTIEKPPGSGTYKTLFS